MQEETFCLLGFYNFVLFPRSAAQELKYLWKDMTKLDPTGLPMVTIILTLSLWGHFTDSYFRVLCLSKNCLILAISKK